MRRALLGFGRSANPLPDAIVSAARKEASALPSDLVRQRVLSRVRQSVSAHLGAPPPVTPGTEMPGSGVPETAAPASTGEIAASISPTAGSASTPWLATWASKGAIVLALAAGGAGVHALLQAHPAAPPSTALPGQPAAPAVPELGAGVRARARAGAAASAREATDSPWRDSEVPAPAIPSATNAIRTATAPATAARSGHAGGTAAGKSALPRPEGLAAERALLERARTTLGRGDGTAALVPLARHAADFRRGQLVEERESMWVKALALSGRRSEAEARAEVFRRRFPHSLFLPVVEAALRASPP